MQKLADLGYRVHSDAHHADDGVANYALGLLWMKALFGNSPIGNSYRDFRVDISEKDVLKAQKIVEKMECLI
jgi:sterol desaturase/sphingolipid hydroxylase (fatty acid hydroxylase superfamily)